jgi:hypothetical protein
MTVSKYQKLCITQTGFPTKWAFTTDKEVEVGVFANWLTLNDTEGDSQHAIEVHEGILFYKNCGIAAFRGPNDGIFFFVWAKTYGSDDFMVGCSVEVNHGKGVTEDIITWFRNKVCEYTIENGEFKWTLFDDSKFPYYQSSIPEEARWLLVFSSKFCPANAYP